jgi:hypothetical protein
VLRRRGIVERPYWFGWGAKWWLVGAYLVIVWGDGPFRVYRSRNGTPWHHIARRIFGAPMDRAGCVCEECRA